MGEQNPFFRNCGGTSPELGEQPEGEQAAMLTDADCKNAKCPPEKRRERFADAGGLYLEVSPKGAKRWFLKYRKAGKESRLALGSYPAVSLKAARQARDKAKDGRAQGLDPVQAKKAEKLKAAAGTGNTFEAIANEWFAKRQDEVAESTQERDKRLLQKNIMHLIGSRPIADITHPELLAALNTIVERGVLETAERVRIMAGQIYHYAIGTGRADRNIAKDLQGNLPKHRSKGFAAIIDPEPFGLLLRAIKAYKGGIIVRAALQLVPYLFQRPNELRGARWQEMDLAAGIWTIPPQRMKRSKEGKENGQPHFVPLPKQAVAILEKLKAYTYKDGESFVFPSDRQRGKSISGNSVRTALISMGYTGEVQTWHGFRASARTMLAEQLDIPAEHIEPQLAHAVKDANGRSYNRTTFLRQRKALMQEWADYIDQLEAGVIPAPKVRLEEQQ